jgi:hypothetical protein
MTPGRAQPPLPASTYAKQPAAGATGTPAQAEVAPIGRHRLPRRQFARELGTGTRARITCPCNSPRKCRHAGQRRPIM